MTQLSIFFGSDGHLIKPPVSCHSLGFVAYQPLVWPHNSGEREAHHAPAFQVTVAASPTTLLPNEKHTLLVLLNEPVGLRHGVNLRRSCQKARTSQDRLVVDDETICQPKNPVKLSISGFAYESACCVGVLCQHQSICCVFPSLIFQSNFRLLLG